MNVSALFFCVWGYQQKGRYNVRVMSQPRIQAYLNAIVSHDGIILLYRNASGVLCEQVVPCEYVSYLSMDEFRPYASELRRTRAITGISEEGGWVRLRWSSWQTRREACGIDGPFTQRGLTCKEADVSPLRRYMVDHSVQIATPRKVYLDIETDSRVPFSEKERARILCWSLVDYDTGEVVQGVLNENTDVDERRVLNELWVALDPYDMVIAWMSPYKGEFDFEMIRARTERVKATVKDWRRWLYLDHCKTFVRMNSTSATSGEEKQSYKLNAIATALVGESKDDFDSSKTWRSWVAGGAERERLFRYNRQDSRLMYLIERKTGFIALFHTICEVCGCFPESRSLNPSNQLDPFMLRLGRSMDIRFPSSHYDEEENGGKYDGAFVLAPRPNAGILRNIHVMDFASMYPNIILTWNMSPETKDSLCPVNGPIPPGVCRSPATGVAFRTDTRGTLPTALAEMLRLRKHWNSERTARTPNTPEWYEADRRATAYKVAANSFYGLQGSPFSRYYDREVAESITQTGVWLIKKTIGAIQERTWEAVYGDTDSTYVRGPSEEEMCEFEAWLNAEFYPSIVKETGALENFNKIAYEKAFDRLVFTAKKKYCGRLLHYKGKRATADTKPSIAGLEFKRGDATLVTRVFQKEVIDLLMVKCSDNPADYELVINSYLDRVLDGKLTYDEVKISKSLSKPLSEFKTRQKKDGDPVAQQPHVMLAHKLLERGLINSIRSHGLLDVPAGTKIEFVVTDASCSPMKVVWGPEYKGGMYDRYSTWEDQVWPPIKRLLEAAFPAHVWIQYDKVRPKKQRKVCEEQGRLFEEAPQIDLRAKLRLMSNLGLKPSVPAHRRKK